MSRVRTGHGPNDWSEPDEGVPAHLSGSSYMAGTLVQGEPGYAERERLKNARKNAKRREVDLEDYPRHRWDRVPLCGVMLPLVGEPCARRAGHKYDHWSRANLDSQLARQRRWQEKRKAAA